MANPLTNNIGDKILTCSVCGEIFPSRNKLFRHIQETELVHTKYECAQGNPEGELRQLKKQCTAPSHLDSVGESEIITVCEDDWYRVVVKPQGLATMGTKGVTLLKSSQLLLPGAFKLQLAYKKAVPCHRLDRATGGLMVCSKSKLAERVIMTSFKRKLVRKKYLAIVIGKLEPCEGVIDSPISSKAATTKYEVSHCTPSAQYGWVSTVQLWPITGRKHQLRRHLQSLGHPIIGDRRFSLPQQWPEHVTPTTSNMFLWAVEVNFPHPQYLTHIVSNNSDGAGGTSGNDKTILAPGSDDDEDDDDSCDVVAATSTNTTYACVGDENRVIAQIREPVCYAEFREIQESAWNAMQMHHDANVKK